MINLLAQFFFYKHSFGFFYYYYYYLIYSSIIPISNVNQVSIQKVTFKRTNYKISSKIRNEITSVDFLSEDIKNSDSGYDETQKINEYITSLLNEVNESNQEDLFSMFQHIIYFSSNDIDQNSIFLNHQFLERLINYYLFELNISSVFIICHNIITDSNFNLDLLNIIIESNYIPFFLKNFQSNEHFLTI